MKQLKVLFLVFHGFSEHNGISKKIWGQAKGLRECGADLKLCYYEVLADGRRVWLVDDNILVDFGKGLAAKIKKRTEYSVLTTYVSREKFGLVYIRSYHNANPFTIGMVKKFRDSGAKVVMEIPTYPYDQEYTFLRDKIVQRIDKLFRRHLAKNLDAIVTFSRDREIFGQRTIRISNGIDFDALPLRTLHPYNAEEIHLIGVAEIHYWHGYDRLIKGLGHYYLSNPSTKVYFHVVGNVGSAREETEIHGAIVQGNLQSYVLLHGALWGSDLDAIFNQSDFAIGSLGRHRSGITHIRTLKNREYAARGISFIYSETDDDFEGKPYVLKAPPDESFINIQQIVDYCRTCPLSPMEIRQDIKSLSWSHQMQKVIDSLNI